jgi:U3 small nucleolar RNA-associated protein 7
MKRKRGNSLSILAEENNENNNNNDSNNNNNDDDNEDNSNENSEVTVEETVIHKEKNERIRKPPKKMKKLENSPKFPERRKKYERGKKLDIKKLKIKNKQILDKVKKTEKLYSKVAEELTQSELLLTEESGFLETEGMEKSWKLTQKTLLPLMDLQTVRKVFDLNLDQLGPYTTDYSRNGRHLLIAGEKGHVALMDWTQKYLLTELHLNETCRDAMYSFLSPPFNLMQYQNIIISDKV